jgi:hypothetical protein
MNIIAGPIAYFLKPTKPAIIMNKSTATQKWSYPHLSLFKSIMMTAGKDS